MSKFKKFCKDCTHYHRVYECARLSYKVSPITGEVVFDAKESLYCVGERSGTWLGAYLSNKCGPQARFFRQKETDDEN